MSDRTSSKSAKHVIGRAAAAALFESLENRQLLCAEHDTLPLGNVMGSFPVLPNTPSGFVVAATGNPSATVPALTSRPGASAKLYLDFDGASAMSWGSFNVTTTPKYDTDNNTTEFSASELAAIQNIFNRVAEAYSPFNIDVTTIDPGNLTDGTTLRAVIGGNGSWYGSAGGVAYVGGFTNGAPNTVFIFPKMLANGDVKYTADAISHESGHGFGLQHQSSYSGASKTAEYNPGTSAKAPTMGNSYSATRSLWWYGQSSVGSSTYQDDVVVLSNNTMRRRRKMPNVRIDAISRRRWSGVINSGSRSGFMCMCSTELRRRREQRRGSEVTYAVDDACGRCAKPGMVLALLSGDRNERIAT